MSSASTAPGFVTNPGLSDELRRLAVQNLLVDRVSAEVIELFDQAGIDSVLLKGPSIAEWLYSDGSRSYRDTDLLVSLEDWPRAIALLEREGFHDYLKPMAHPRMESIAGTAFVRASQAVDLHATISGLGSPPGRVWETLRHGARPSEIARRACLVPSREAILMHLALHAADDPNAKPLSDLRRGLAVGTDREWRAARELAASLDGLAAFAAGLRNVSEGARMLTELGLEKEGSIMFDLRATGVPTAEALHELFAAGVPASTRLRMVGRELVPNPAFMRWSSPIARRGFLGLVAAYPLRWLRLLIRVPRGLVELGRVRGRRRVAG